MSLLFTDFASWQAHCAATGEPLYQPVLAYEIEQKGRTEEEIWAGLQRAYDVMRDAVHEGLTGDMTSRSGMINNGAKKIAASPVTVLSPEFKQLITRALGAKEVNSCMGRVVAAPTAGASGILPGVLVTLQDLHKLDRPPDSGRPAGGGRHCPHHRAECLAGRGRGRLPGRNRLGCGHGQPAPLCTAWAGSVSSRCLRPWPSPFSACWA